ncbi:LysE family translocator [Sphingosinicella sp. CPCC 101087]|uniref:LysE family translocator n=1 Tax=Sphingosinicella sp. CPCC 101087 TaxID=2497754 RepID=UPI001980DE62|nr:LysE family translocator [Sphingosinicella sp. CPCC 101087]
MIPFLLAATAMLGTPGPGIAALVAVGRSLDRVSAFRFYAALQLGLAIAAALSVLGLVGLIQTFAALRTVLMLAATLYLLWLAWKIAFAPVGAASIDGSAGGPMTGKGAFFLGIANPKAYLAFASLFGSFTLLPAGSAFADGALKWGLCIAVILVVDLAWLCLGMTFGRLAMSASAERLFNRVMGAAILGACLVAWL